MDEPEHHQPPSPCDKALEEAVKVNLGLTHAVEALTRTVEDQQATIDAGQKTIATLDSQIGALAQALAEAQTALNAETAIIASQQATIAGQEATIAALTAVIAAGTPGPRPAVRALITFGGMPVSNVSITVDDTAAKAALAFEDDHGDVVAAPAGAVITWTSDNTAAITVATDPSDPTGQTADLSVVATATAGESANVGASIADASGNPILTPAGTPFSVSPVNVSLVAGPAAEVVLSVTP